jgi:hypothetical protein
MPRRTSFGKTLNQSGCLILVLVEGVQGAPLFFFAHHYTEIINKSCALHG